MKSVTVRFLPLLLLVAAVLAGCGSSSSSSSTSTASSASAPSSTRPAAAASSSTGTPVVITTKHSKMGTILAAGSKRLTVYLFEGDKGQSSSCSGACAAAWPPVIGKATVSGTATSADLGATARADGRTQVTYKGHPLYFFVKDKDDGDAYGQGVKAFGADWYVLAPSGTKVDKS